MHQGKNYLMYAPIRDFDRSHHSSFSLSQVILEKNRFSEAEAKPIFYQIASALEYMHRLVDLLSLFILMISFNSNGVIHRDIKPENILVLNQLDPKTGIPVIKILDFGLSKHTGGGSLAKTFVGANKIFLLLHL
jgi:serine/threonine protein kinase